MRYVLSFIGVWLLTSLAGCQKESIMEEGEGDKVALEFDLYQANVTKATTTSSLKEQAIIKVYAFKVESRATIYMSAATLSAEGTYVVAADKSPIPISGQDRSR